jgi:murein L,D-transpeptidase YcbB/YkuD
LRTCESGGNYQANTGNGFYGAYQFDLGTWHGLGYSGLPSDASPSTQDAAARELQSERGWQPWPACSRKLGLGSDVAGSSAVTVSSAAFVVHPAAGPMSEQDAGVYRSDVEQLQSDLRWLGYDIGVDGHFGPQTAATVREFQAAAQLTKDGIAGKQTLHAVRAAKTVLERGLARALERALAEQNRTV